MGSCVPLLSAAYELLGEDSAKHITYQICDALAVSLLCPVIAAGIHCYIKYIHSQGVAHRDLKPEVYLLHKSFSWS